MGKLGDFTVTINIDVQISFWDALKLRVAGPEVRDRLLLPIQDALSVRAEDARNYPRTVKIATATREGLEQ